MMNKTIAFALIFIMAFSFAIQSNAVFLPSGYDSRKVTVSQPNYGSEATIVPDMLGNLRYWSVRNRGSEDISCTLTDENGTTIFTTNVTFGSVFVNRTVANYSNYGNLNVTCASNYLASGATLTNASLLSWWKLDEGTGNTSADNLSRNTLELLYNNGTANNSLGSWTTSGYVNNATALSAVGGFLRANVSATLNISGRNFSISLAHKLVIPVVNNTYAIYHQGALKGNATTGLTTSGAYVNRSVYITWTVKTNATTQTASYNATALAGAWNTYDFDYNGTAMVLRVNGTNVTTTAFALQTMNWSTTPLLFGDGYLANNSAYFAGASYDEIYIFNATLTGAQAQYINNITQSAVKAEVKLIAFRQ